MLKKLLTSPKYGGVYNQITNDVCGGIPTAVFGVSFAEKCRIVNSFDGSVLYIVRDSFTAKKAVNQLNGLSNDSAVYLPAKDDCVLYKSNFDKENLYSRLTALYKIQSGVKVVVTTFEALMQLFPKKIECFTFEKDFDFLKNQHILLLNQKMMQPHNLVN